MASAHSTHPVSETELAQRVVQAARLVKDADALLITTGAGMGCDSGLPDFRGPEGFWRAFPPFQRLGLRFEEMSTPHWFEDDPELAWGFFGYRAKTYRAAQPHEGYDILRRWGEAKQRYFSFTSNVDGHFLRAGYPEELVHECHGSLSHMQCTDDSCASAIWPTPADLDLGVDESTFRSTKPMPTCPTCNAVARPNVLMFHDASWFNERADGQYRHYRSFLRQVELARHKLVVVEIGAGKAVPTVRCTSEECAFDAGARGALIRINLREADIPMHVAREGVATVELPMRGLEALQAMDAAMAHLADARSDPAEAPAAALA